MWMPMLLTFQTDAFVSHVRHVKHGLVNETAQCPRRFVHPLFCSLFSHMRNTSPSDAPSQIMRNLTSTTLPTKLKKIIELGFLQECTNEEITLTYIHYPKKG